MPTTLSLPGQCKSLHGFPTKKRNMYLHFYSFNMKNKGWNAGISMNFHARQLIALVICTFIKIYLYLTNFERFFIFQWTFPHYLKPSWGEQNCALPECKIFCLHFSKSPVLRPSHTLLILSLTGSRGDNAKVRVNSSIQCVGLSNSFQTKCY